MHRADPHVTRPGRLSRLGLTFKLPKKKAISLHFGFSVGDACIFPFFAGMRWKRYARGGRGGGGCVHSKVTPFELVSISRYGADIGSGKLLSPALAVSLAARQSCGVAIPTVHSIQRRTILSTQRAWKGAPAMRRARMHRNNLFQYIVVFRTPASDTELNGSSALSFSLSLSFSLFLYLSLSLTTIYFTVTEKTEGHAPFKPWTTPIDGD